MGKGREKRKRAEKKKARRLEQAGKFERIVAPLIVVPTAPDARVTQAETRVVEPKAAAR